MHEASIRALHAWQQLQYETGCGHNPGHNPGHNLGAHGGKYRSTREGPRRARRQLAARSDGCRGKPKGPLNTLASVGRCRAGRATGALVPTRAVQRRARLACDATDDVKRNYLDFGLKRYYIKADPS